MTTDPLAEPGPGLKPLEGEIIVTKQYASAFFATSLASTLTYYLSKLS